MREVCRSHGVSPAAYYQWKSKYGARAVAHLKTIFLHSQFEGLATPFHHRCNLVPDLFNIDRSFALDPTAGLIA